MMSPLQPYRNHERRPTHPLDKPLLDGPPLDKTGGILYAAAMTIIDVDRRRAMAAGFCAIALWGALAALSVTAGPVPPFQMIAMTFAVGASIGIVRALARGVGWAGLLGWPPHLLGALLGFAGTYALGCALALGCAFTWSLYSVLSRRFGETPTDAIAAFCAASAVLSR